jgi:hypothetical protein
MTTITKNDGKIEYIKYDSQTLHVKLTIQALGYGWTNWGSTELANHVIRLLEKRESTCRDVKISKLARQIKLHCLAYNAHFLRSHANPVDMTWMELK